MANQITAKESLMKEILDKLYRGEEKEDNKYYSWLRNPPTGATLQLDRYYPKLGLAFEYNGPDHKKQEQKIKDRLKFKLALRHGVLMVSIWGDQVHHFNKYPWKLLDKVKELETKYGAKADYYRKQISFDL